MMVAWDIWEAHQLQITSLLQTENKKIKPNSSSNWKNHFPFLQDLIGYLKYTPPLELFLVIAHVENCFY